MSRTYTSSSGHIVRQMAAALALAVPIAFAPSVAQASSIVFVKDYDVWLTSPDGARQHRVTNDGSAASPYRSPSQADEGTIVAARGDRLFRLRQNGELLNP